MGPCIVNIFQYISKKMKLYTVYLYLETALHVWGGTTTHCEEHIQLYLQHLVPDAVDTVVCAPDDGWRYHPKHVERFPDINKLCKIQINQPTRCNNFSSLLLDVYVWRNMFRASSRPSPGAQQLQ
jgi:hypothetical protein